MKLLFYIFFLVNCSISAQIKGVVKDSISGKPIPYTNIWIENENIGTTSEENGAFSLGVSKEKDIVFSAMGYEKKTIKAANANSVNLAPKVFELNEIIIKKRKVTKELVVGDFKGIRLNSGVTNTAQENVHVWSKFIRFNEKIKECPFIKSIEFVTESSVRSALLRIRVFNISKDGTPIGDAIDEDVLVPVKKGHKNKIVDLAKYNIVIPEEGILIGFEYLKLEQNKIVDKDGETAGYEPSIRGFFPGGETLTKLNRDGTLLGIPGNYGNIEIALKIKLTN